MDLWNTWTAFATGLFIGASAGMLLTALLTISSRGETVRPEEREKKAEISDPSVLRHEDAETLASSMESTAESRVPLHFH